MKARAAPRTTHQRRGGAVGYRGLWRAGEALLRGLDLPRPFSVGAQCDAVRQARGRPLIVLPLPRPASDQSPYGLWVEYPDADFILHEAGTSPAHRDQIILHEIAHILLGHGAAASFTGTSRRVSRDLVSDLTSNQPAALMIRHAYGSTEERHAEIVASLLMGRIGERPRLAASAAARSVHDYRALCALRPLWSAVTATVPQVVLGLPPAGCSDLPVMGADLRLRLGRRIVEIRDAALLLRSHVSDISSASARAALAAAGLSGEELDAAEEAAWLRAACAARLGGGPPACPVPARPLRGADDLTGEARWLRRVAAAWNRPATVGAAAEICDFDR